ncbi:nucleotidyltransferase domain-containing protein [Nocardia sp. BSTN01]|uniref:nucleotidyltransferase domain-containing protein n=1 Tax=Nocardia sp. BSTN01 TaxID=2783665 RepID=UPI00188F07EA|nr:nucleotidyltransferase domain-containing protein [Nocardia sp. BSTN01]MBF4998084.1 nucleotidyltransferase domain-containing protein [Nocardia sp. BSTN01]
MTDEQFCDLVATRLAALHAVQAVTLGGSRATGTHTPKSDWDFAIYYRGHFSPGRLREIGWPGTVSEVGEWGGGVFNGGAWLTIDGRAADIHYRDLDVVEHEIVESRQGRFHWEPLMFHLAGIPSYLLVAELALNRVLRGQLPRPQYPQALRTAAPPIWRDKAEQTLRYARKTYPARSQITEVAGALATAAMQTAHAVLAARGEWVTNEKRLLHRAGLREFDEIIAGLRPEPATLDRALAYAQNLLLSSE